MHRHGYKGRKFGRMTDQRGALMKNLATALIEHQTIKTTLPKAKELRPFVEKLITRAKKGGLFDRRLVIARLDNVRLGNLLVDEIAPQIKRDSGYLRITKLENRLGDGAPMAEISFVDDIVLGKNHSSAVKAETAPKKAEVKKAEPTEKAKTTSKKKGDK